MLLRSSTQFSISRSITVDRHFFIALFCALFFMLAVEKNELVLSILGEERMLALVKAFPAEPIYPNAVFHLWQIKTADEMIKLNRPVKDIVAATGVSRQTVYNRTRIYLGIKPKRKGNGNM
jgi:hypothetical protein